jgi:hypothetical protein
VSYVAQTFNPRPVILYSAECIDRAATASAQLSFSSRNGSEQIDSRDPIQQFIGILRPWSAELYGNHAATRTIVEPALNGLQVASLSPQLERSTIMPLIQILEVLIVVGVLLWLVNRFIPMQGSIKSILNGVVVIAVVLWLLNIFGLFHSISNIHVGKG